MATTLRTRLEAAGAAYLRKVIPGINAYAGHSSEDDALPKTVFSVRSMEEVPFRSGNFTATIMVEVKWHASAGSDADAESYLASVQNAIWITDLEAQLMSFADAPLTIFGAGGPLKTEYSNSDDVWVASLMIELNACIQTLTETVN
jgi:hypothetical protein